MNLHTILLCLMLATRSMSAHELPAPPRVIVATYAYPEYNRRHALTPLAQLIERGTKLSVEIVLFNAPTALAAAIRKGSVDIAMTNLAAFLEARQNSSVQPMALLLPPPAVLERYRGVLLAHRRTGLGALEAMRTVEAKLRYSEVLPGSTSGALVQATALQLAGIERASFQSITFAGSHELALKQLLTGATDVAALAEAPWLALKQHKPDEASELIELWRSAPLPPGPVICVQSAKINCGELTALLLQGDPESAAAATELARGWSETQGSTHVVAFDAQLYADFDAVKPELAQ